MSEDFYAALMMRRALPPTTNIKTITEPGIYPVDSGNTNAPVSTAGVLVVLPPTTRPKLKFIAADWNVYTLVGESWQGLGTSAIKDVVTSPTDTTAGRVLTVGYHGLGSVAPRTAAAASDSYDNIPTGLASGFYTHAVSSGPYALTFTLLQDGGGKLNNRHLIIPMGANNKIAVRFDGASGEGSKDYQYFYTDKNKPTAADVGALRLQLTNLSVDLNTLGAQTDAGLYQQQLTANATTANHYPINEAGSLLVSPSAYGCQQEYTSYSSRRKFIRGLTSSFNGSGPWSGWIELYSPQYPGEIYGTSANNFRIAYGGYGTFWRNDGANLYLMLTNKDDPLGSYNALRPFAVNLATGDVTIGKLGLVNYANFDARYQPKGAYAAPNAASKAANGWWQDTSTGVIYQWVQGATTTGTGNQTVTFPKAFPNACLFAGVSTLNPSDNNDAEQHYQLVSKATTSCVVKPNQSYGSQGTVAAVVFAIGY